MNTTDSEFTVTVNYEDWRFAPIDHKRYGYGGDDLRPEHFPILGYWTAEVVMTYVTFDHEPIMEEVFAEMNRRGLRIPDRAETEAFHEKYPAERTKGRIIGISGSSDRRGYARVACIGAYEGGLVLHWCWFDYRFGRRDRFLAVKK